MNNIEKFKKLLNQFMFKTKGVLYEKYNLTIHLKIDQYVYEFLKKWPQAPLLRAVYMTNLHNLEESELDIVKTYLKYSLPKDLKVLQIDSWNWQDYVYGS